MNTPACLNTYLAELAAAIDAFGPNKSQFPVNISFAKGRWWIHTEIDTARATFDTEYKSTDLNEAMTNTLSRIRREARIVRVDIP